MTIQEVIDLVDRMKPNQFQISDKIRWINELEAQIKTNIIDRHHLNDGEYYVYIPYTEDDLDKTLLIEGTYEGIYEKWLYTQIDLANGDTSKYNNSAAVFNDLFSKFENFYNKTHITIGRRLRFV